VNIGIVFKLLWPPDWSTGMFETNGIARDPIRDVLAAELVALLARVADGDHKSFRRLYDLTHRRLFGVALLLLKQRDAAEDIVQEAFIRIWAKAGFYDVAKGSPMPWLARIVRNIAFDHFRRKAIGTFDLDDQYDLVSEPAFSVFDVSELNKCLASLDPVHRAAWWMIHLDGRSFRDVAKSMNVPLGTVKSWVHRSSRLIRMAVEG
jgi:RNA polymerase sigma-70 factor, ECF subfamily